MHSATTHSVASLPQFLGHSSICLIACASCSLLSEQVYFVELMQNDEVWEGLQASIDTMDAWDWSPNRYGFASDGVENSPASVISAMAGDWPVESGIHSSKRVGWMMCGRERLVVALFGTGGRMPARWGRCVHFNVRKRGYASELKKVPHF